MKKYSCPKCKTEWEKNRTIRFDIHSPRPNDPGFTDYKIIDLTLKDFGFCPRCFSKNGARVILREDNIKLQGVVVVDEFGNYKDLSLEDFKTLSPSNFGDFEDDVDDHNSVWGGAGPDCSTKRREAAICREQDKTAPQQ